MITSLVLMYEKGAITADHLADLLSINIIINILSSLYTPRGTLSRCTDFARKLSGPQLRFAVRLQ